MESCSECGGTLKIIAAIEYPPFAKILTHLGLQARSTAPTPGAGCSFHRAPSRASPWPCCFRSTVGAGEGGGRGQGADLTVRPALIEAFKGCGRSRTNV
jgi:hypothetical protein